MFKLKPGVNNCTNEEYHGDKTYLSSSQLKLILKDKAEFKDQVLDGNRKSIKGDYLTEGSYTHSLILEPHMVEKEYAVSTAFHRRGKEWKEFLLQNEDSGKILLSKAQSKRCETYYDAFSKNDAAVKLVDSGEAEHSICAEIEGVKVKMRADWINVEGGYIADVKTTAFEADLEHFKLTIDKYQYDLSGALYSMVAEAHYGKPFDFYYIAISKSDLFCEVFKTSKETMELGRLKVIKALKEYKESLSTNDWTSPKKFAIIEPTTDYEIKEI